MQTMILNRSNRGKRNNIAKPLKNNIPPAKVHIKAAIKSKYRLEMPGLIANKNLLIEFIALNLDM
jgi:hypothetical protein